MTTLTGIVDGTRVKCRRAWLITWDWIGDHARVEDSFVAILNYRYSSSSVARMVEQIYVTSRVAFHEQLAYAKNRKSNPYRVQHDTVEISKEKREKLSLPSSVPFADTMRCGENPWLWARIVYDLEAYVDEDGQEHLKWKERRHSVWEKGELKSEWEECHLASPKSLGCLNNPL